MADKSVSKRTNQQLGLLVRKLHPEIADNVLREYVHVDALDADMRNVSRYYHRFCEYLRIIDITTVEQRKLFSSAMMRIYCPGVYKQHSGSLVYPLGLGKEIRRFTGDLKNCNGYRLMRQAIMDEHLYDEYRQKVDIVMSAIYPLPQKGGAQC